MTRTIKTLVLLLCMQAALVPALAVAAPVGSTFTYQGRLHDSGSPASGNYDFTFGLFEDAGASTPVGSLVVVGDVIVGDGVFSVELDFGGGAFTGDERWLKISVRLGSSTGPFTELLPLQPIRPAPYAMHSPGGGGQWTTSGADIYFDSGRVGIGTATPGATLDVAGKVQVDGTEGDVTMTDPQASINFQSPNGGSAPMMHMYSSGTNNEERVVIGHSPPFPSWGLKYKDQGDAFVFEGGGIQAVRVELGSRRLGIGIDDAPDGALHVASSAGDLLNLGNAAGNVMTVLNNGNVGIGVQNPATKLEIQGTTTTDVLTITGGSDLAEPFDLADLTDVMPGTVLSIDPENPGQLRISSGEYERTVAGVVSGGNGIRPGLLMSQENTIADGSVPVALTGRAYVRVDASSGPIECGDLLTTSGTPGHAMKVTDYDRAQGAILGKALTSLDRGTGMVLVLVTLQ